MPELGELLLQDNMDILITGFSPAKTDQLQIDFKESSAEPADEIAQGLQSGPVLSKRGSAESRASLRDRADTSKDNGNDHSTSVIWRTMLAAKSERIRSRLHCLYSGSRQYTAAKANITVLAGLK